MSIPEYGGPCKGLPSPRFGRVVIPYNDDEVGHLGEKFA